MNNPHFPNCYDPFRSPSFIVPVVVSGILVIIVFVMIGILHYNRHTKPVRQIRECLAMNPARFVHTALRYVMWHHRAEEDAVFDYDIIVFTPKTAAAFIVTS